MAKSFNSTKIKTVKRHEQSFKNLVYISVKSWLTDWIIKVLLRVFK